MTTNNPRECCEHCGPTKWYSFLTHFTWNCAECPCHQEEKVLSEKEIRKFMGDKAHIDYERNHSHYHCWNQEQPSACGIPLEKHKYCCLCDTPYYQGEKFPLTRLAINQTSEVEELDDKNIVIDYGFKHNATPTPSLRREKRFKVFGSAGENGPHGLEGLSVSTPLLEWEREELEGWATDFILEANIAHLTEDGGNSFKSEPMKYLIEKLMVKFSSTLSQERKRMEGEIKRLEKEYVGPRVEDARVIKVNSVLKIVRGDVAEKP